MTQKKQLKPKQIAMGCGVLVALTMLFAIFLSMGTCGEGQRQDESGTSYSLTDAVMMSRSFVEDNLKAPGSAEFPYFDADNPGYSRRVDDTTFVVISYVDAQNGFGAKLRSDYSCMIIFHPATNKAEVKDLSIIPR